MIPRTRRRPRAHLSTRDKGDTTYPHAREEPSGDVLAGAPRPEELRRASHRPTVSLTNSAASVPRIIILF